MIKKFDEFVNEGMMSKMWRELDGEEERKEEVNILNIKGVEEHHSFKDNNGVFHKNGYKVIRISTSILQELVKRLIEIRGDECDLNDIDVSNINMFGNLFCGTNFNGDISGWDVSSAISLSGMFYNCPFNKDISNWDVQNVSDFSSMFCSFDFTVDRTNINISGWKVSSENSKSRMRYMFYNAIINEDFHNWKVNSKTNKDSMFLKCENKNQFGIPKWYRGRK